MSWKAADYVDSILESSLLGFGVLECVREKIKEWERQRRKRESVRGVTRHSHTHTHTHTQEKALWCC